MTDLIDNSKNFDRNTSLVIDNPNFPIKAYQDIYNQITGKTESIKKSYTESLLLSFEDIEQLHIKINQLSGIHNVLAKNTSITILHKKDRKEQFTSFERFKTYNANSTSPTIRVILKYNFSILQPELDRPQEYVITAILTSKIAAMEEFEEEAPAMMRGHLYAFMSGEVVEIKVEYVDYVVARSFMEACDDWVVGCKKNAAPKVLDFAQEYSHFLSPILKMLIFLLVGYMALTSAPKFLADANNFIIIGRFFIIFSMAAYILPAFASFCGRRIEHAIDSKVIISYVKLNKGDERIIEKYDKTRNNYIWNILIWLVGSVLTKLAAHQIELLI